MRPARAPRAQQAGAGEGDDARRHRQQACRRDGVFRGKELLRRRGAHRAHATGLLRRTSRSAGTTRRPRRCACQPARHASAASPTTTATSAPTATPTCPSSSATTTRWRRAARRWFPGLPDLGYTINRKSDVWSDNVAALYEEAKARRWTPAVDIDWAALQSRTRCLPTLEAAVSQLCTALEEIALVMMEFPSRWVSAINQEFLELKSYLCAQMIDEARHVEVFRKRALAGGSGLKRASATARAGAQGDPVRRDLPGSVAGLQRACSPAWCSGSSGKRASIVARSTNTIFRLCGQDTARELAYGMGHMRYHLQHQPQRADVPARLPRPHRAHLPRHRRQPRAARAADRARRPRHVEGRARRRRRSRSASSCSTPSTPTSNGSPPSASSGATAAGCRSSCAEWRAAPRWAPHLARRPAGLDAAARDLHHHPIPMAQSAARTNRSATPTPQRTAAFRFWRRNPDAPPGAPKSRLRQNVESIGLAVLDRPGGALVGGRRRSGCRRARCCRPSRSATTCSSTSSPTRCTSR